MLAGEFRPCSTQSGKQAIVRAEEPPRCLQGPDTQALIVVSPLHISQTKLTECTWPFTHSLFSPALLHSSSSLLLCVWSRCNHLSLLLLDCPISGLAYNRMSFHTLEPTQVCFSPKNPQWILLLFRPVFLTLHPQLHHLVSALTPLCWPRLLIPTEVFVQERKGCKEQWLVWETRSWQWRQNTFRFLLLP